MADLPGSEREDRNASTEPPEVRILLATFNGAAWLDEQLASIAGQRGVRISVTVSDDQSSDATPSVIASWRTRCDLHAMAPAASRFGSAHRNFLRLIRDADPATADYVALSDQDDVWLPDKLARAVDCLETHRAQGYSSNVTALWPDGSRSLIDKAQPQRRHDHLFESPGPGCTFVLTRDTFVQLRAFVRDRFESLQSIWVHDWLIYAFVRARGGRWYIDPRPGMLYRQHASNEIGANAGWHAALRRLRHVRSGAYRRDVLAIADAVGDTADAMAPLRRLTLLDRLHLVRLAHDFRRRRVDRVMLSLFFLVMPRE